MFDKKDVEEFIESSILHSSGYDGATDGEKTKAVNQSINTVSEQLDVSKEELDVQDVAEQTVFLFKLDGTLQRAELGVDSVNVDGISISLSDVETTLAPSVKNRYGIKDTKKRRTGRYVMGNLPFKRGNPYIR